MAFAVEFRDVARDDLVSRPGNIRKQVVRVIESRLTTAPARYGNRLRKSLRGYWKLRVGDNRIVCELSGLNVVIWAVKNRRDVYPEAERRIHAGKGRG